MQSCPDPKICYCSVYGRCGAESGGLDTAAVLGIAVVWVVAGAVALWAMRR
jgi:hypothetical protein